MSRFLNDKMILSKMKKRIMWVTAFLLLMHMPFVLHVSAVSGTVPMTVLSSPNVLHFTADDVNVSAGQNSVDMEFRLEWADTTPFPLNSITFSLTMPAGQFDFDPNTGVRLASGVPGSPTIVRDELPFPAPNGSIGLTVVISNMGWFSGDVSILVSIDILPNGIPNNGDSAEFLASRGNHGSVPGGAVVDTITVRRGDGGNGNNGTGGGNGNNETGGGNDGNGSGNDGNGSGNDGTGDSGNNGTGGGSGNGNNGTGGGSGTGGSGSNGTGDGSGTGIGGGGGNNATGGGSGQQPRLPGESGRANPWTGDDANLMLWLGLFGAGALGLLIVIIALVINKRDKKGPTIVIKNGTDGGDLVFKK